MQNEIPVIFDITILFQAIYDFLIFFSEFDFRVLSGPFSLFSFVWFFFGLIALFLIVLFYAKYLNVQKSLSADLSSYSEVSPDNESVVLDRRWVDIIQKIESENPSDWNVAIMESDKILDEMVKKMGYPGDNLGERLKSVEKSDFLTLDQAWQAHKIRNSIAHESDFVLTKREARRALLL